MSCVFPPFLYICEKNRNYQFMNKKVFITGGAEGIGRAIVKAFRKEDAHVAFCDINRQKGEELAAETGATFLQVDVRQVEELESHMRQLLSEWGDLDIIVNNVVIGGFKPITEASVEDFDNVLSTNLRPVFITSRLLALHRKMQKQRNPYGRIVNLSSTRYLMSEPGSEGYAASKGGICSLTHALAISLSEYNITVNSISPGWIENYHYDELRPEDHLQHPSRRVGHPEDIARTVLFLCQDDNNFINGENITVDGGMTKKMIYLE